MLQSLFIRELFGYTMDANKINRLLGCTA
jgi:hypothetical protein